MRYNVLLSVRGLDFAARASLLFPGFTVTCLTPKFRYAQTPPFARHYRLEGSITPADLTDLADLIKELGDAFQHLAMDVAR